ncbi:MAG: AAA family ATPase [Bacteroidales bacterium]|nr:AAA family ATPase [Bacteroidales bacterium]
MILQGYAYIDKTRFIENLEKEDNRNHFFIRPAQVRQINLSYNAAQLLQYQQ